MPGTRLSMRKVREVLRLKHALGMSERLIAEAVGAGKSAVGEYIRRARVIGLTWPLPDGLDDAELERRLVTPPGFHIGPTKPQPHWPTIQEELKGRGVTLLLLWEEYRAEHADGYGYSRFCDLYRSWRKTISPTMRQTHGPAEKLCVDWAGAPVFGVGCREGCAAAPPGQPRPLSRATSAYDDRPRTCRARTAL